MADFSELEKKLQLLQRKIIATAQAANKELMDPGGGGLPEFVKESVLDLVSKGISPVAGEGRFVDYSDSYKYAINPKSFVKRVAKESNVDILHHPTLGLKSFALNYKQLKSLSTKYGKKLRPVNLNLSGDMLKSIYIRAINYYTFEIGFTDPKADIHTNKGAGKKKVIRKILPQKGEEFSRVIMAPISKITKEIFIRKLQSIGWD